MVVIRFLQIFWNVQLHEYSMYLHTDLEKKCYDVNIKVYNVHKLTEFFFKQKIKVEREPPRSQPLACVCACLRVCMCERADVLLLCTGNAFADSVSKNIETRALKAQKCSEKRNQNLQESGGKIGKT